MNSCKRSSMPEDNVFIEDVDSSAQPKEKRDKIPLRMKLCRLCCCSKYNRRSIYSVHGEVSPEQQNLCDSEKRVSGISFSKMENSDMSTETSVNLETSACSKQIPIETPKISEDISSQEPDKGKSPSMSKDETDCEMSPEGNREVPKNTSDAKSKEEILKTEMLPHRTSQEDITCTSEPIVIEIPKQIAETKTDEYLANSSERLQLSHNLMEGPLKHRTFNVLKADEETKGNKLITHKTSEKEDLVGRENNMLNRDQPVSVEEINTSNSHKTINPEQPDRESGTATASYTQHSLTEQSHSSGTLNMMSSSDKPEGEPADENIDKFIHHLKNENDTSQDKRGTKHRPRKWFLTLNKANFMKKGKRKKMDSKGNWSGEKENQDVLRRYRQKIQELEERNRRLEKQMEEEKAKQRICHISGSPKKHALEERIRCLEIKLETVEKEKQDALNRLSAIISANLRNDNPNIVDLNDQYRPEKLAEMFSELYDNEWTNAFLVLQDNTTVEEKEIIAMLFFIVRGSYTFSQQYLQHQWETVTGWYLHEEMPGNVQTIKALKEAQKLNVLKHLPELHENFFKQISAKIKETTIGENLTNNEVRNYISGCLKLSLLMVATDPPVVMKAPGWSRQLTVSRFIENLKRLHTSDHTGSSGSTESEEKIFCYNVKSTVTTDKQQFSWMKAAIFGSKNYINLILRAGSERKSCNAVRSKSWHGERNTEMFEKKAQTETSIGVTSGNTLSENGKSCSETDQSSNDEACIARQDNQNKSKKKNCINTKEEFDKSLYKDYTKRGKHLSYIVWPVLFLHEDGPLLCKGVAQGTG